MRPLELLGADSFMVESNKFLSNRNFPFFLMFSRSRENRDNFSYQYISYHKYAISQNIRTPVKEKTIVVPSNYLH